MSKRILVATDLTDASSEALRQASALASSTSADLAVCYVVPRALGVHARFAARTATATIQFAVLEATIRDALAAQLTACLPGITAELFVEQGDAHAEIVRRAEAWSADVVVVGNRGRTELPRLRLGSVATQVVRHAHCPVLVARDPAGRGTVLVATDLSDPSMPAVVAGADEARRRNARLVVLHAIDFGSVEVMIEEIVLDLACSDEGWNIDGHIRTAAAEKIRRAVARFDVEGEARVVDGSPTAAAVRVARSLGAELLVVGTRGRTGLARMALGSTAENIVRSAPCSVLAVRLHSPGLPRRDQESRRRSLTRVEHRDASPSPS